MGVPGGSLGKWAADVSLRGSFLWLLVFLFDSTTSDVKTKTLTFAFSCTLRKHYFHYLRYISYRHTRIYWYVAPKHRKLVASTAPVRTRGRLFIPEKIGFTNACSN